MLSAWYLAATVVCREEANSASNRLLATDVFGVNTTHGCLVFTADADAATDAAKSFAKPLVVELRRPVSAR